MPSNINLKIKSSILNKYLSKNQVQVLNAKQSEQDATAQTYRKRIQENQLRVEGMKQETEALNHEIQERNQTIREKVILLLLFILFTN